MKFKKLSYNQTTAFLKNLSAHLDEHTEFFLKTNMLIFYKEMKILSSTLRKENPAIKLKITPHNQRNNHGQNITNNIPTFLSTYPTLNKIKCLDLTNCFLYNINFTLFPNLEIVFLHKSTNLTRTPPTVEESTLLPTPTQIKQLPKALKELNLRNRKINNIDFSHLENLKKIDLFRSNFTQNQLNQLPIGLEEITIDFNQQLFNLSQFKNLITLTVFSFNETPCPTCYFPSSLQNITLGLLNIENFDFNDFPNLVNIHVPNCTQFNESQFNQFPTNLKQLSLGRLHAGNYNLSRLEQLSVFKLYHCNDITADQFNQLSTSVTEVALTDTTITNFIFRRLEKLETLKLNKCKDLTDTQFNQLPTTLKHLDIENIDVTNFNFGRLENLETISLSWIHGSTKNQIDGIPENCTIKNLLIM